MAVILYFWDFSLRPFILSWKVVGIEVMLVSLHDGSFVVEVGSSKEGSVERGCCSGRTVGLAGLFVACFGFRCGGLIGGGVVGWCWIWLLCHH